MILDNLIVLFFVAFVAFVVGVIIGRFIERASHARRYKGTFHEFVTEQRQKEVEARKTLLSWMKGNRAEMLMLRLHELQSFRELDYVGPIPGFRYRLLSDREWRRAKDELVACGYLHVPWGRSALLTSSGLRWLNHELGMERTMRTDTLQPVGGSAPDGFRPIPWKESDRRLLK